MRNKRVVKFALAGLLAAIALQAAGYRMDHAIPRIALGDQALYNWLTLLFSPVAFFLRLGNPDGPIIGGWTSLFLVLASNAVLYPLFCRIGLAFLLRLQVKLTHEHIPALVEQHPERVVRLASPNWRPRRA